jgi:glycosyltransferase involved in cell wall biosynthesis
MDADLNVSVIMPVHNGMPFLAEAVESILAQTMRKFEFLIIDDGSTDDTPNLVRSSGDARVKYHRLERVGLVEALNYGLRCAEAGLVARMDADDVADESLLAKQSASFVADGSLVLKGCGFTDIDQSGSPLPDEADVIFTTDPALRWLLLYSNPFLHSGVMYPRHAAQAVGGYRKAFDLAEDYDLWVRLSDQGRLANHPEALIRKRDHGERVSVRYRERQRVLSSEVSFAYASARFKHVDPQAVRDLHLMYSSQAFPGPAALKAAIEAYVTLDQHVSTTPYEELRAAISHVRQRLRWRCVQRAKSTLGRPWESWRWAKAARAFDPDHAFLAAALARLKAKMLSPA